MVRRRAPLKEIPRNVGPGGRARAAHATRPGLCNRRRRVHAATRFLVSAIKCGAELWVDYLDLDGFRACPRSGESAVWVTTSSLSSWLEKAVLDDKCEVACRARRSAFRREQRLPQGR